MNKQDLFEKITTGREFHTTYQTGGFQRVLLPMLQAMLDKADKDCHDFKKREDHGKWAIVKYNTIKDIMKMFDEILKDMEMALDYCNKHNIKL